MASRCLALLLPSLVVVRGGGLADFDAFLARFGKAYDGPEYAERKALFEERARKAEELNARPGVLWTAGVSAFFDLRPDEIKRQLGYNKLLRRGADAEAAVLRSASGGADESPVSALPQDVDWRRHVPPVITPVKRQGGCGSCWAFAAVEEIESYIALATGVLLELSVQQLNSCTPNPRKCGGAGGCSGATAQLAFDYSVQAGLSATRQYPYVSGFTGMSGECLEHNLTARVAGIQGYQQLERNNARDLARAVAQKGPVSVVVDASIWFMYSGGIFDDCNNTSMDINHAVQLVGYGVENGTKYWLVRNSWGAEWGESGYIRLRRYDDEPCGYDETPMDGFGCEGGPPKVKACGECGVLSDSSYPLGAHLLSTAPRRLRG